MKKNCKLVVFDMDGTVLDTLTDLMNAVNRTLRANGYPERTRDEIRRFVGNGIYNLVKRALPDSLPDEEINRVYTAMMDDYALHSEDATAPYPGVVDAIRTLKNMGYKTAIVTNKAHPVALRLCDKFFPGLFDFVLGETPRYARKPAPDTVLAAMEALGESPDTTLYVGDSETDYKTACNACLDCITVLWGFRKKEEMLAVGAKEENFIYKPEELVKMCNVQCAMYFK